MPKAVVMFSGGVSSWAAAKRTAAKYGVDNIILLFADTRIEDKDLYRFLDEAAADVGAQLIKIADGRTPWEVFRDEKLIGNSKIAPCSKLLKQIPARRWMAQNAPDAKVVLGMDWTEMHRVETAKRVWAPWEIEAPLCDPPLVTKQELLADLVAAGIEPPALYREGFPHNNCGGGCVRAGAAHFAHLYRRRPETFAEWERNEAELQKYLKTTRTILRERRNGQARPLSLSTLRQRIESQPSMFDDEEWGGCGCFVDIADGDDDQ
jgi:3'-phosphoadenosine 5'-phosphosulfate sulfotransferase (PAPS reductase)/FAD synthetase